MRNRNFHFAPDEQLDLGGAAKRYATNLNAIRLARLARVGNHELTPDEQRRLAHYVGWGDNALLKLAFPDGHAPADEIAELLSDDEIDSLRRSSLNAHYTSLEVVRAMWQALMAAGLGDLPRIRALDPSAGIGHFAACTPEAIRERTHWSHVELDIVTADILSALRPDDCVQCTGFQQAELVEDFYNLVISNVPFGDYAVYDKRVDARVRHSIHDYFFAKALHVVRPGGLVAFITSRYTLDKHDSTVRRYLAQRAELLGVARLPETAFRANAHTDVVTDILVLRRRAEDVYEPADDWIASDPWGDAPKSESADVESPALFVNRHVQANDWLIAGEMAADEHGMYGRDQLTVKPRANTSQWLGDAIRTVLGRQLPAQAWQAEASPERPTVEARQELIFDAAFPAEVLTEANKRVIASLQDLYTHAKAVIRHQIDGDDDATARARAALNQAYDAFAATRGQIRSARVSRLMAGHFAYPFLAALETADGSKADIFTRNTVRPIRKALEAVSAVEALGICLDEVGKVDMDRLCQLTGLTQAQVAADLTGLIYCTPKGEWQTADQYLSGNIKAKLAEARAAARLDPALNANVAALEQVYPKPLAPGDIRAPLGAPWIPEEDMAAFLHHLVGADKPFEARFRHLNKIGTWDFVIEQGMSFLDYAAKWATSHMRVDDLLRVGMNGQTPTVYDKVYEAGVEKRTVNQAETVAAQAKLEEIKSEFEQWLWADGGRAQRLADLYNDRYNIFVTERVSGAHMQLPGLSDAFTPRSYQKDGAYFIVTHKATLIPYPVRYGKTLTVVMGAMESKRLGLVHKPMVVVPNNIVGQWASAIRQAYPAANVLVADKDTFNNGNRQRFISTIAHNDWDFVVIAMSQFKLLAMSSAKRAEFIERQIEDYVRVIEDMRLGSDDNKSDKRFIKQLENAKANLEAKLETLNDMKKDDERTITFEELGVDMLVVDEADNYKNLMFVTKRTRIAGLPNASSERAFDLWMKTAHTLGLARSKLVFLTGTYISNSIAELYTMQRYLQPDMLAELGWEHFDAWANSNATTTTGLAMTPDGGGFRLTTRFNQFVNVPELRAIFGQVMAPMPQAAVAPDTPTLIGGKPHIVSLPKTPALAEYVQRLVARVEKIKSGKVTPAEDNMLAVTSDGRKAALDLRLVMACPRPDNDKASVAARNIKAIADATADVQGTQLVFLDIATPKANCDRTGDTADTTATNTPEEAHWINDVYSVIKSDLIALGMSSKEIAFIHDCKNDKQRMALYAKANAGEVRVVIGSTEKMGAGVSVERLLCAEHHIDAPWRPRDITQRDGRMLSPVNLFHNVALFRYVTEGSFDGYMWQTLESKQTGISAFERGDMAAREIKDVGDTVLSISEVKAIASGNPKVILKAGLDNELLKLQSQFASWRNARAGFEREIAQLPGSIAFHQKQQARAETDIAMRNAAREAHAGKFKVDLLAAWGDDKLRPFDASDDANEHFMALTEAGLRHMAQFYGQASAKYEVFRLGRYLGFDVMAKFSNDVRMLPGLWLRTPGGIELEFRYNDNRPVYSMIAAPGQLDDRLRKAENDLKNAESRLAQAQIAVAEPFPNADKMREIRSRLAVLDIELNNDLTPEQKADMLRALGADNQSREATDGRIEQMPFADVVAVLCAEAALVAERLAASRSASVSARATPMTKAGLNTAIDTVPASEGTQGVTMESLRRLATRLRTKARLAKREERAPAQLSLLDPSNEESASLFN